MNKYLSISLIIAVIAALLFSLNLNSQEERDKAMEDVNPDHLFVVAPVDKGYSMKKGIDVVSLSELTDRLTDLLG